MESRFNKNLKRKNLQGFTLVEILVTVAVVVGVMVVIGTFSVNVLNFKNFLTPTFQAQQEMQLALQTMSLEMHSMALSNIGSYPLSQVGTSTITFFSDIDSDGLFEQVRYFLSGTTLKKGVIKPSGNPLSYNPLDENIDDTVHYIYTSNPAIFTFYESGYSGIESPLVYPVDISKVQLIGVDLFVKDANMNYPVSFSIKLTPRNLRSN